MTQPRYSALPQLLAGLTVVFTGELFGMSRSEAEASPRAEVVSFLL